MFYLVSLIIIALIVAVFYKFCKSHEKQHWTQQTFIERLLLSVALSTAIQFLYFTAIPGWFITAMILGKNRFYETDLGNLIWITSVIFFNIILYLPIFYLLLCGLQKWYKSRKSNSDLILAKNKA